MKFLKLQIKSQTPHMDAALAALQYRFSQACNYVAELAFESRTFSRVRLHHVAYRATRQAFPDLGSQLVSNAIYAVCRKAKSLGESSPREKLGFAQDSPVFFDRHTISVKGSTLSMLTLDGRIKFQVSIDPDLVALFRDGPLKELLLVNEVNEYFLCFYFNTPIDPEINSSLMERAA